jgi:hypothetical protein
MAKTRTPRHALPNTRTLAIIAQDPSIKIGRNILVTDVQVPAEELLPGPCGYRVNVIDYDASTNTLYKPPVYHPLANGHYPDPYALKDTWRKTNTRPKSYDARLLDDPGFHAQNVYAIVMRTLARFEFALGRRVPWGSDGHQLHVAPHAFADANAFYSRDDRGLFFGYFIGANGKRVYTCLSHDVVAHEATHAILDGMRSRYMEVSTPEQAAFHEGFADVVALLSVFSLSDVVEALLGMPSDPRAGANGRRPRRKARARPGKLIARSAVERDALAKSVLLGLADEMGEEVSGVRGKALRRSVELEPGHDYMSMPEYQEEHALGELLVAAMMNTFLDIWLQRIEPLGFITPGKLDRARVVEEGARVAGQLLTMAIRAIDYCPPTDIRFSNYLSALLTVDQEVVPEQGKFDYRKALLKRFEDFGILPAFNVAGGGTCELWDPDKHLIYSRSHYDSMLRDKEEVFRFIWENRAALEIREDTYVEVLSVRPSIRVGPDGFVLQETVAEYIQILTVGASELKSVLKFAAPAGIPGNRRIRLVGGGTLVFSEYGQLKYHILNRIDDRERQQKRLESLLDRGFFDEPPAPRPAAGAQSHFARLHLSRATR